MLGLGSVFIALYSWHVCCMCCFFPLRVTPCLLYLTKANFDEVIIWTSTYLQNVYGDLRSSGSLLTVYQVITYYNQGPDLRNLYCTRSWKQMLYIFADLDTALMKNITVNQCYSLMHSEPMQMYCYYDNQCVCTSKNYWTLHRKKNKKSDMDTYKL